MIKIQPTRLHPIVNDQSTVNNRLQQHKRSSHTQAKEAHMAEAYPSFKSMKQLRVLLYPLDGMLVHRRITPSSMSPVPIYTPGWRETMWGKVSCLRKRHGGRDWASNHRPSDLKSNMLTTTPLRPHLYMPNRK